MQLQDEMGLSLIFIAHDLSVIRHISDRVLVMYLGNPVELGEAEEIYKNPLHPYTKALMSAVPIPDPKVERKKTIEMLGRRFTITDFTTIWLCISDTLSNSWTRMLTHQAGIRRNIQACDIMLKH